ncbi:hypothetical protein NZNM25_11780 [Nitrosopumilus zosterae]|uniref:Uncharacterized protein n=1 Tax=Nitrosopumilus zosterae TaxID=718286 RepID=A0A2S2KS43_9ARCH|nr:hypothetical protein [Nitrosopumilus zosterae]BDQ30173.1 hypothetical protein NZOSNM25_000268 [Nitrosopumilus zosterae]GBH34387.1 hypothetical protein NZNM25_11780 [Nitrosopumilus zosterae]
MNDSLLDDVKALLDKDFGDDRILKQIYRACENNEVISNYERTYVQKLAEKHLGKRPEILRTPTIEQKPITPDVAIPQTQSIQKMQTFQQEPPRKSYLKSKNSKIMLGITGLALIIIIGVAASFSFDMSPKVETPTTTVPVTLSIQSDLSSYNKKDLISISGVSNTSGTVNLSIENPNNELVWAEQVSLKSNGAYSTLAIAGGQGWENSGTYTIKVDNGKETKSITFAFKA